MDDWEHELESEALAIASEGDDARDDDRTKDGAYGGKGKVEKGVSKEPEHAQLANAKFDFNAGESESESEDDEDDEEDGLEWQDRSSNALVLKATDVSFSERDAAGEEEGEVEDVGVLVLEDKEKARAESAAIAAMAKGNRRKANNGSKLDKEERKKQSNRQKKKKMRRGLEHRMELLAQLGRLLKLSSECDDCEMWIAASAKVPVPFMQIDCKKRLGMFLDWFAKEFVVCDASELAVSSDDKSDLERALVQKRGPALLLTQLFVVMCRSVGIPCRLCAVLQPRELKIPTNGKSNDSAIEQQLKKLPSLLFWVEVLVGNSGVTRDSSPNKRRQKPSSQGEPIELLSDSDDNEEPSEDAVVASVESAEPEWVFAAPPLASLILRPKLGPDCPYVVACGAGNFAVDVTAKYAERWTKTSKKRHFEGDGWWHIFTLEALRNGAIHWLQADPAVAKALSPAKRQALLSSMGPRHLSREEAEMAACRKAEEMPTSIDGFKRHPTMILASQVSKFNVAMPGTKPVGTFKGTKVLLRADIRAVRSERQWKKLARVVDEDEKDCPAKMVKMAVRTSGRFAPKSKTFEESVKELKSPRTKKVSVKSKDTANTSDNGNIAQSDDNEDDDVQDDDDVDDADLGKKETPLYGEWQTFKYIPPEIGPDGKVPTSEYGNVEMWTPAHCPKGGTHVQAPLSAAAASKLGIPYAPAMIGFEVKDGRQIPKIQGIVVASMHAATIEEAAGNLEQERLRKAEEKRVAKVLGHWERFVKWVLVDARMKNRYAKDSSSSKRSNKDGVQGREHMSANKRRRVEDSVCMHEFESTGKRTKEGKVMVCTKCSMQKIIETL